MATALSQALRAIAGIYRTPGGSPSAPESVEVGLPLQLVHDVSREAELASGFFEMAVVAINTAGAGAATFASQTRAAFLAQATLASRLQSAGLDPSNVDVWVYGVWGEVTSATSADFADLRAGLGLGIIGVAGARNFVLERFNLAAGLIVAGGNSVLRSDQTDDTWGPMMWPILLPNHPNSAFLVEASDDATGAIVAQATFLVWVGPSGSPPPLT